MRLGKQQERPERPVRVRQEDAVPAADEIARATLALKHNGLHVKWSRLTPEESADLIALTAAGRSGADGKGMFDPDRLDRKQAARWEALVEKGSDSPGIFGAYVEQARFTREIRQLARRAIRPEKRARWEEPGAVIVPHFVFSWLNRPKPALTIQQLGLLVFLLTQLEHNECLTPHGRVEGTGDDARLVISLTHGLGAGYDPYAQMTRWKTDIDRLAAHGWITVERYGPEAKIGRGRLALKVANERRKR